MALDGRDCAFKFRGIREKFELSSQGTSWEAMTKIKPRVLLIDILSKNQKNSCPICANSNWATDILIENIRVSREILVG